MKYLKQVDVSNVFFLYYLSFFPAFWTKPFPFRYFFDTHAFQMEPDNFARVIFTDYQVVFCLIYLAYAPSII